MENIIDNIIDSEKFFTKCSENIVSSCSEQYSEEHQKTLSTINFLEDRINSFAVIVRQVKQAIHKNSSRKSSKTIQTNNTTTPYNSPGNSAYHSPSTMSVRIPKSLELVISGHSTRYAAAQSYVNEFINNHCTIMPINKTYDNEHIIKVSDFVNRIASIYPEQAHMFTHLAIHRCIGNYNHDLADHLHKISKVRKYNGVHYTYIKFNDNAVDIASLPKKAMTVAKCIVKNIKSVVKNVNKNVTKKIKSKVFNVASSSNSSMVASYNSSAEASASSPVDTSFTSSIDTSASLSTDTPSSSPVDISSTSSIDTSSDSPVDTLSGSSIGTPFDSLVDTLSSSPVDISSTSCIDTSVSLSADTLSSSPVDISFTSCIDTSASLSADAPSSSPVDISSTSCIDTSVSLSADTLLSSQVDISFTSCIDMSSNSPVDTLSSSPVDTPSISSIDILTSSPVHNPSNFTINSSTDSCSLSDEDIGTRLSSTPSEVISNPSSEKLSMVPSISHKIPIIQRPCSLAVEHRHRSPYPTHNAFSRQSLKWLPPDFSEDMSTNVNDLLTINSSTNKSTNKSSNKSSTQHIKSNSSLNIAPSQHADKDTCIDVNHRKMNIAKCIGNIMDIIRNQYTIDQILIDAISAFFNISNDYERCHLIIRNIANDTTIYVSELLDDDIYVYSELIGKVPQTRGQFAHDMLKANLDINLKRFTERFEVGNICNIHCIVDKDNNIIKGKAPQYTSPKHNKKNKKHRSKGQKRGKKGNSKRSGKK